MIKKIFNDCFTGNDNKTVSLLKITFAAVQIIYLILSIWDCYLDHDFKMVEFGTGEAAIIAAFGSAMWMSKDTQPEYNKNYELNKN